MLESSRIFTMRTVSLSSHNYFQTKNIYKRLLVGWRNVFYNAGKVGQFTGEQEAILGATDNTLEI